MSCSPLKNLSCIFTDDYSCEFGSSKYYALCGFGGILSCGITHTAVVPLDLVKCRIQVRKIFIWERLWDHELQGWPDGNAL